MKFRTVSHFSPVQWLGCSRRHWSEPQLLPTVAPSPTVSWWLLAILRTLILARSLIQNVLLSQLVWCSLKRVAWKWRKIAKAKLPLHSVLPIPQAEYLPLLEINKANVCVCVCCECCWLHFYTCHCCINSLSFSFLHCFIFLYLHIVCCYRLIHTHFEQEIASVVLGHVVSTKAV